MTVVGGFFGELCNGDSHSQSAVRTSVTERLIVTKGILESVKILEERKDAVLYNIYANILKKRKIAVENYLKQFT